MGGAAQAQRNSGDAEKSPQDRHRTGVWCLSCFLCPSPSTVSYHIGRIIYKKFLDFTGLAAKISDLRALILRAPGLLNNAGTVWKLLKLNWMDFMLWDGHDAVG